MKANDMESIYDKEIKCCICGHKIDYKSSHNPFPLSKYSLYGIDETRCCNVCNDKLVMPLRLMTIDKTTYCKAFEDAIKKNGKGGLPLNQYLLYSLLVADKP